MQNDCAIVYRARRKSVPYFLSKAVQCAIGGITRALSRDIETEVDPNFACVCLYIYIYICTQTRVNTYIRVHALRTTFSLLRLLATTTNAVSSAHPLMLELSYDRYARLGVHETFRMLLDVAFAWWCLFAISIKFVLIIRCNIIITAVICHNILFTNNGTIING